MLDAAALRHKAIASNLANIETPGYQRVDVNPNFAVELSQAMNSNSSQIANLQPALVPDASAIANGRDGNTVQLEKELISLNQNTIATLRNSETQLIRGGHAASESCQMLEQTMSPTPVAPIRPYLSDDFERR